MNERRVVISSLTGKPMQWEPPSGSGTGPDRSSDGSARASGRADRPLIPDRAAGDEPDPPADESNDARLAADVPPHWGRGA